MVTKDDYLVKYYPLIRRELIKMWGIHAWVLRGCYVFADGRRVPLKAMIKANVSLKSVMAYARDPLAQARRNAAMARHNKRVSDALSKQSAKEKS